MPGRDGHVDAAQGRPVGARVAEADVVQPHLAAHRGQQDRVLRLLDVHRQVQVLEDPAEQLQRALHVDARRSAAGPCRAEQALLQGGERDQRADRDGHVVAPAGQPGHPVDDRGHGRHDDLDRRLTPAARHARGDLEVGQLLRLGREGVGERARAAHRVAEHDAADRERLLHDRGDHGELALPVAGDAAAFGPDPAAHPDEERQHDQRRDGQPPVEDGHRDDGGDHGGRVGDQRGGGGGDGRLHAADVVGDARLHLAGAGLGEEGERHALQVRVDGGAQVVHDPLADLGGHVGLGDAERAVGDRHHDHAEGEHGQQAGPPLGQRHVDDRADQERVDQRDERGSADQEPTKPRLQR